MHRRPKHPDPVDTRLKQSTLNLNAELKFLKDPAKLAEHVAYTLGQGDEEKALALTRMSSRALSNVVSWNHVIDWQMKKGKTKAAFETYNDMKKRKIKPDTYTYIMLLRGLGNYAHHPQSLSRALSLYHSISAPGNAVAPTIMHTNAVLKVCARANDMESLWDIASRLPERGPHAADNFTFTTIINNLRLSSITRGRELESLNDTARRIESTIVQGRRLWQMVIQRWQANDIKIDEDLTCSIGRLLLIGSRPRDWDDVFSLVQQTMDIPRMVPRLSRQEAIDRHQAASASVPDTSNGPPPASESTNEPHDQFIDVFAPAEGSSGPSKLIDNMRSTMNHTERYDSPNSTVRHAQPGPSTLSLILEACLKYSAKDTALAYWSLLTAPDGRYAITPDLNNMHMHLLILRRARSSSDALAFLRDDFPAAGVKPDRKSFEHAMATCVRDAKNPQVHETAGQILDMALNTLADPGALLLHHYLDILESPLISSPPSIQNSLRALERMEPGVVNLRSMVHFGSQSDSRREMLEQRGGFNRRTPSERLGAEAAHQKRRLQAVQLMQRAVGHYDRLLDTSRGREGEVDPDGARYLTKEQARLCQDRKARMSAFVQRQIQNDLGIDKGMDDRPRNQKSETNRKARRAAERAADAATEKRGEISNVKVTKGEWPWEGQDGEKGEKKEGRANAAA